MELISGTVERFLFQDEEKGFAVFVLQLKEPAFHKNNTQNSIEVRGSAPALQAGQDVDLSGLWVIHPKFGKQFEAEKIEICLPTSISGLKKYLG